MSYISEILEVSEAKTKKEKISMLRSMSDVAFTLIVAGIDPWQIWFVSDVPSGADELEFGDLDSDTAAIAFLQILDELKAGLS